MKKRNPKKILASVPLAASGQIQLLRIRVSSAESTLKEAKAQYSQAKARKKIAKLLAKRARKGVKEAKVELANAREEVERVEAAERASVTKPVVKKKVKRAKPVARSFELHVKQPSEAPWPPLVIETNPSNQPSPHRAEETAVAPDIAGAQSTAAANNR